MSLLAVSCVLSLAACGGGGLSAQEEVGVQQDSAAQTAAAAPDSEPVEQEGMKTTQAVVGIPRPPRSIVLSTGMRAVAADMASLAHVSANGPSPTLAGVGPVRDCRTGYVPPSGVQNRQDAVAWPSGMGVTFTAADLANWRARVGNGPFVASNDFTTGSPGDWARISRNAGAFAAEGESDLDARSPATAWGTHGSLARDAAFVALVRQDASLGRLAGQFLLRQTKVPVNDFPANLCITTADGITYDAWFFQSSWLLRYLAAYDFARGFMTAEERSMVEAFLRRNAYFLAAHIDMGQASVFPKRMSGDYTAVTGPAAATDEGQIYWSKRYDTNGDCAVDGADDARALPAYAYVRADGTLGPRISVLSQFFNNRKSAAAAAFGMVGVALGDPVLVRSAKRYFMEWLTYSVWSDGSQGEYARNGDYCIAPQGVIYGSLNLQAAGLLAASLNRHSDSTLIRFSTRGGLFGTQSVGKEPAKSLESAVSTYLQVLRGELPWYFHHPLRAAQDFSSRGSLASSEVRYMNGSPIDDYHDLGLLSLDRLMPSSRVGSTVLRDRGVTGLRFPGSTGNSVTTGHGQWSDAFNAMPAVLLLRP